MSDTAFVAGYFLATLGPALGAGWLVLRWRRGALGAALALAAALVASWLGLGLFLRVAWGPDFMAPMVD